jgi:hypothetical protein
MKNKEMRHKLSRIESRITNLNEAVRRLISEIDRDEQQKLRKNENRMPH